MEDRTKRLLAIVIDKVRREKDSGRTVVRNLPISEHMVVDAAGRVGNASDDDILLEMSGIAQVASVVKFASDSKKFGDRAANSFRTAAAAVTHPSGDQSLESRLKAMEVALLNLSVGLEAQRYQIGSLVSLNVAGHLLAVKSSRS
jgi:hypothetical protein